MEKEHLLEEQKKPNESQPAGEETLSGWMEKGGSLFKAGKYQDALSAYNSAIDIDPAHGPAYFNRSLVLNKLGDRDRALIDLKVAARFGHDKSQALLKQRGLSWWS